MDISAAGREPELRHKALIAVSAKTRRWRLTVTNSTNDSQRDELCLVLVLPKNALTPDEPHMLDDMPARPLYMLGNHLSSAIGILSGDAGDELSVFRMMLL